LKNDLVDPIKLLVEKASVAQHSETSGHVLESDLPFEVPLTPPPGARVKQMTVAGTYRTPIPVLYDMQSNTTYPLPNNK
jgi:hypothetical protein